MLSKKKGAIGVMGVVILASLAFAGVVLGILDGLRGTIIGNDSPVTAELEVVKSDISSACISNSRAENRRFDLKSRDSGTLEICGEDNSKLCYGEASVELDSVSCDSVRIEEGCEITPQTDYSVGIVHENTEGQDSKTIAVLECE